MCVHGVDRPHDDIVQQSLSAFASQRQQFIQSVGQDRRTAGLKGIVDDTRQTRAVYLGKYVLEAFAHHVLGRAARNARNPLIPADDRPHAIDHDQADVHSVKHCAKHKIGLVGLFNQHDRKIAFRYR